MARSKNRKRSSAAENARNRAETHSSGFENTVLAIPPDAKLFKVENDRPNRLDILAYPAGEGNPYAEPGTPHFERTFWVHRNVGADQNQYVCPAKTAGKRCPVCEFRAKLAKDPDADEALIKDLAPKQRQLFNVIDTANRGDGCQVWEYSFHLFGKLLDMRLRELDEDEEEYFNFANAKDGFTLKIAWEEKSFGGNKFFDAQVIDFRPRKQAYDEDEVEEMVYCLDDLIKIPEYDDLKAIFLQSPEAEEDEDEDSAPDKKTKTKKPSRKPKPKPRPKKDEDIDEADEDEDIDEADEDEDIDEADEDEDIDEADEDEDSIPVGARVIGIIEGEEYPGEVTSSPPGTNDVQVTFDDGDVEMMSPEDLEVVELPKPKKEKKTKKASSRSKSTQSSAKSSGGKKKSDSKPKKIAEDECPHGHTFGVDTDETNDCEDCDVWNECDDAKHEDN